MCTVEICESFIRSVTQERSVSFHCVCSSCDIFFSPSLALCIDSFRVLFIFFSAFTVTLTHKCFTGCMRLTAVENATYNAHAWNNHQSLLEEEHHVQLHWSRINLSIEEEDKVHLSDIINLEQGLTSPNTCPFHIHSFPASKHSVIELIFHKKKCSCIIL